MAKVFISVPAALLIGFFTAGNSLLSAAVPSETKMQPEQGPTQDAQSLKLPAGTNASEASQAKGETYKSTMEPSTTGNEEKGKIKMTEISLLVHPGDKVTVKVKTEPKAICKIDIKATGFSNTSLLKEKTADAKGLVSWTWRLNKSFKGDTLPVKVTSVINGHEENAEATIPVKSLASRTKEKTL